MKPITRPSLVSTALVVSLGLLLAPPAMAQGQDEAAQLFAEVERGDARCGDLSDQDFTAIGELVMGRMLGSEQAHEAMDRVMASMMGDTGLERMHEVMGARLAGCGRSGFPAGTGAMMGMIQMIGGGMQGGAGGIPGGSGQGYGPGGGSGAMMGFDRGVGDDDDGPGAWMAILMLVVVVGAGVAAFAIARPRRAGSAPLDVLAQRFARGEMTTEDYEQRRALLEGGGR